MKVGFGPIGCRRPDGSGEGMVPIYEQALGFTEKAETFGFDSAWVAEHHFAPDGYLPSPVPVAAAIAARTGSLEVGIGLAIAPIHEPVSLAEDASVLNILSRSGGGRFTLGLGLGYRDIEFEVFNSPRKERVGRLLDVVETCREAWGDGPMDFEGRLVKYPEVDVTPKPGSEIQLVLGANSAPGIKRSAYVADGYISPPGHSPDDLSAKLDNARKVLDDEDTTPEEFDVYHMQYTSVHPDGKDAAWEVVRDAYKYTRTEYLKYFNESSDSDLDLTNEEIEERADEFEDRWRTELLHGTPEQVTEELRGYGDCWDGEIHTILQLHYPGLSPDVTERAVTLVGEEIIPELEDC